MVFLGVLLAINAVVLGWAGLIGLRRWREERHFQIKFKPPALLTPLERFLF